jgi:hypothetical protein
MIAPAAASRFNGLLAAGAVFLAIGSAALAQNSLADVQSPEPGLYRTSMTILELDVPSMPEDTVAQMRQMMETQTSTEECEGMDGEFLDFDDMGNMGQDCTQQSLETTSNTFSVTMVCQNPGGGASTMSLQGTTFPDRMEGVMEMDADMGQGVGAMHLRMAIQSERLGDCPG